MCSRERSVQELLYGFITTWVQAGFIRERGEFCFVLFLFWFFETVSLCIPGWSQNHSALLSQPPEPAAERLRVNCMAILQLS